MFRSLHFDQSGLEVKLHNLQLALEDIENAIGEINVMGRVKTRHRGARQNRQVNGCGLTLMSSGEPVGAFGWFCVGRRNAQYIMSPPGETELGSAGKHPDKG